MGLSVAFQAYELYGPAGGEDWEDREIEKEMSRMRTQKSRSRYTSPDRTYYEEDELELKAMKRSWDERDLV